MPQNKLKLDDRIETLIKNGVLLGHRSLLIITGDKSQDQVVHLYNVLNELRARPKVLWCYKKNENGCDNQKKLFTGTIRKCKYKQTDKILGATFGMCVLQDFHALTPNILARTLETVEGGGIIVFLLPKIKTKKQFCSIAMDVHSKYKIDDNSSFVPRFNERFLLSLASCKNCLMLDDNLNVLPFSTNSLTITSVSKKIKDFASDTELKDLKESVQDTQPVGHLINCCKTLDQAKALLKFIDVVAEKTMRSTVSLTAARGRGKSAALGLAIASAIAFGYSNIFVTSPSPENLATLFDFILVGFKALEYEESTDYELIQSTNPEFSDALVRINIYKNHRQTIQYIHPSDADKLAQAELVVIDEAAAIPLPLVKKLIGPYLVFMASTINGYEGTGRSLSLKLIAELRDKISVTKAPKHSKNNPKENSATDSVTGRSLFELELNESVRYRSGDDIEKWLNKFLCLDASMTKLISSGFPLPNDCDLYYINRDTLFSCSDAPELFLQRLMSLYVTSHYKNTPNDLQMIADDPAHHLFCLLGPLNPSQSNLPEIICVIQVCLEGNIEKEVNTCSLSRGKRAAGDLIPWTISDQFGESSFANLSGARIVRIATHPIYQQKGYGRRALEILEQYYCGGIVCLDETIEYTDVNVDEDEDVSLTEQLSPRKSLPQLLLKLSQRPAEKLDYIGVSFGVTRTLLPFWRKTGFVPVYVSQKENSLTGEHSCIMLKCIGGSNNSWLQEFWKDFRRRFLHLLGFACFRKLPARVALGVIINQNCTQDCTTMSAKDLAKFLTNFDLRRLDEYTGSRDRCSILDMVPRLAQKYFEGKMEGVQISALQMEILLAVSLQFKTFAEVSGEMELPEAQVRALYAKCIKIINNHLNAIKENEIAKTLPDLNSVTEAENAFEKNLTEKKGNKPQLLIDDHLKQFAVKGSEHDWDVALASGLKGMVSVKGLAEKRKLPLETETEEKFTKKHSHKKKKFKKHK